MPRQLTDLEQILANLLSEHKKLLGQMEEHQVALRQMQTELIDDLTMRQECTRLRIATLEVKRKTIAGQIARLARIEGEPTITRLAEVFPQRREPLFALRDALRDVMEKIQTKATIASRLAGAVLGHLNTAVRLLAGAVEHAGIYTKNGTPRVAARIGAIEAVG